MDEKASVMNYKETSDFLCKHVPMFQSVGKAGYKADLDNTHYLDELFGHPHRNFKTIHIAGTNGKGSVSSMIASVLTEAGYKTGLYTSPHLIDFRERIRINGIMIPEQEVVDFVDRCIPLIEKIKPTFFELTTVLAFHYFAKEKVDVAVIETGMGGRLDCTNIITPELSVITNIALDHTEFLGNTLPEIAGEKAGIIKPGVPVVIGERYTESDKAFIGKAHESGSDIVFAEALVKCEYLSPLPPSRHSELDSESPPHPHNYTLTSLTPALTLYCPLAGTYQTKNICTAFAALGILKQKFNISESAIKSGFEKVKKNSGIRGRWEVLGHNPLVVCDTGHNPHGIKEVVKQIESCTYKDLYMVIGMMNDKDITAVLELLPKKAYYIFTQADIPRAMEASVLAERAMRGRDWVEAEVKVKAEVEVERTSPLASTLTLTSNGLKGEVIPNVFKAYQKALSLAGPEDIVFVGGSTFVVADLLRGVLK